GSKGNNGRYRPAFAPLTNMIADCSDGGELGAKVTSSVKRKVRRPSVKDTVNAVRKTGIEGERVEGAMFPKYTTPDELAKHLGCSPRRVRSFARRLGVARVLGNRVILLQQDIDAIMEATRCPSSSIGAVKSGTTAAQLPEGSYADLQ